MLAEARDYLTVASRIAIFPGMVVMLTMLGFHFEGRARGAV
jgi:ABC-type dipeptide/oligopeptide/nickel transport system permease subunit